ncbi:MAG: hypothetical protein HGN29_16355, partial [Asgard group archaeon]|nr:hypothetical protein [Asgard group archaeon]
MFINRKSRFAFFIFSSILLFSVNYIDTINLSSAYEDKIGHVLLRYHLGADTVPTYAHYIQQYLEEIGIEVTLINQDWDGYVDTLLNTHDYDLTYVGITNFGTTPEIQRLYTENGSLDICRFSKDIPYYNESEQMQNLAVTILELEERQQLYFDWQQLMMDKIVPIFPLDAPKFYSVIWSNIKGYDMRWGFDASCPYMRFDGLHEGQVTVNEFNTRDAMWSELNPLLFHESSSSWIYELTADPLLQWSPDQVPLKTGLIDNWEQISDDHFKFYLRDDVYWNPSFNVTERTSSSTPLITGGLVTDVGELMLGLKDGEYSDGT